MNLTRFSELRGTRRTHSKAEGLCGVVLRRVRSAAFRSAAFRSAALWSAALLVLLGSAILAPLEVRAQSSATANGTAHGTIIMPIKSSVSRAIDFGKWVINEKDANDNWVTLADDASNTVTNGTGVMQIAKNSHPAYSAEIIVTGAPNSNFSITNTVISIAPQEGTLVLSSPAAGTLDASGNAIYYVGGTWTWTSNGDANDFDASISSIVNYD